MTLTDHPLYEVLGRALIVNLLPMQKRRAVVSELS